MSRHCSVVLTSLVALAVMLTSPEIGGNEAWAEGEAAEKKPAAKPSTVSVDEKVTAARKAAKLVEAARIRIDAAAQQLEFAQEQQAEASARQAAAQDAGAQSQRELAERNFELEASEFQLKELEEALATAEAADKKAIATQRDRAASRVREARQRREAAQSALTLHGAQAAAVRKAVAHAESATNKAGRDLKAARLQHRESRMAASRLNPETLVCDADWQTPLIDTRRDPGPARFMRTASLSANIALTHQAFTACSSAKDLKGPCSALQELAEQAFQFATPIFYEKGSQCSCLANPHRGDDSESCEAPRRDLTALRGFHKFVGKRAELVLAVQLCKSPQAKSNGQLLRHCSALDTAISGLTVDSGLWGAFHLMAPLPLAVAEGVAHIRTVSGGYFGTSPVTPSTIRQYCSSEETEKAPGAGTCEINFVKPKFTTAAADTECHSGSKSRECQMLRDQQQCVAKVKENNADSKLTKIDEKEACGPLAAALATHRLNSRFRSNTIVGLCNEFELAAHAANSCRKASIYVDEKGQVHLNAPLNTRRERRNATLCVDTSDFNPDYPLLVSLGVDAESSVPVRAWPGEVMSVGDLIDSPVRSEDVLRIEIAGKPHGISLAVILENNGVENYLTVGSHDNREACRVSRSYVPVVDHEIPVGDGQQTVIPMDYTRGRLGATKQVADGDYVLLWVKQITPSGAILVQSTKGERVRYNPPPLLGLDGSTLSDINDPATTGRVPATTGGDPATTGGTTSTTEIGPSIGGSVAGVAKHRIARRSRYPGSRVLRLGYPKGGHDYKLKVCTGESKALGRLPPIGDLTCGGDFLTSVVLKETMRVHGRYYLGVKAHYGYTYNPASKFGTVKQGEVTVITKTGRGIDEFDLSMMLAFYPLGRDPTHYDQKRDFSILAGFTVKETPWNKFYAGIGIPLTKGVSFDILARFSRDVVPVGAIPGAPFPGTGTGTGMGTGKLTSYFPSESRLIVGASFGISMDYNLFEKAFVSVWNKVLGSDGKKKTFLHMK